LNGPVTMSAPRLVIGGVVGAFPSRVHTYYLTRPRLGRSIFAGTRHFFRRSANLFPLSSKLA
ncbi:hypothetical protein, partial [Paenibacillus sp. J2TS4]|uniref:hypothetical protein n=1 Tax=Paenibacillus sp. J2TS4 TaxID=2807194 RepID=UPI001BCEEFD7